MRNNNLKRFLTTASALGMIAIGAQNASAAQLRTSLGNVTLSGPDNLGLWVTGDTILLDNNAHTLALDSANAVTSIVVAAGVNANTATVTQSLTLGAVSNNNTAAAAAAGPMELTFGGAATVTLNGAGTALSVTPVVANSATTYNQLGTVNFANTASTLLVTGNTLTIVGAISSTNSNGVAAKGIISVTGATGNNTFSGIIGAGADANAVGTISVAASAGTTTFSHDNKAYVGNVVLSGAGNVAFTGANGVRTTIGDFDASASTGTVGVTGVLGVEAGHLKLGSGVSTLTGPVTVTAGNVTTGTGAANFNGGLTVTAGNVMTGTGLVTVAGAATTLTLAQSLVTLGGNVTTGQNIAFTNGGRLDLQGNTLTLSGNTVSNADISGTAAGIISVNGGNATLSNVNVGYGTVARGGTAGAAATTPAINVATANTLTIDAGVIANGQNYIYSAIHNTADAAPVAGNVVAFTAANGAGTINLHDDIGEDATNKRFAQVTIGANTTVNLVDGASIYTGTIAGGTLGTVNMAAGVAILGLGDGSMVNGVLTPGGADNGTINVNTISDTATIERINTANALLLINFNKDRAGAAATENGLVIASGSRATPTVGTTLSTAGISFGANAIAGDVNTGLTIDMTGIAETDTATNLTIGAGNIAVTNAGAGRISFIRSDDKQVTQATLAVAGNTVGGAATPLGLINAAGTKELIITNTGAGFYANDVDAPILTLTGGGTYGINVSGAEKTVNVSGANVTLAGITASGAAVANIGNSTTSIKEFHFATAHTATVNNGVNIYADNITTQTTNNGAFTFAGTSIVSGQVGSADKKLTSIAINNAGSNVTFQDGDMYVNTANGVTFNAATSGATFLGNVHSIVGTNNANGIAIFGDSATSAITVDGLAANGGIAVNQATINGTLNLTLGAYDAANTTFLADGTLNLTKDITVTGLGAVTATQKDQGTIAINSNHTTTGTIGTAANGIKAFTIGEKATLTIADGHNLYAKDTTGTGANVTFQSAGANTSNAGNLGAAGSYLAAVRNTGTGAVIANDIYSDAISITAAGGSLTAKNFKTTATAGTLVTTATSTAIISDGGSMVKATGAGNVTTSGDATVTGLANTGNFTLNGAAGKVVTVTDAAIAGVVVHNTGTLALTKDTTVAGAYTAGTAVLNLGANSLTTGAMTVITSLKLNVSPSNGKALIIAPSLANNGVITIVPAEAAFATGTNSIVAASSTGTALVLAPLGRVDITPTDFTTGVYAPATGVITWTTNATRTAVLGNLANTKDENLSGFADSLVATINDGAKGEIRTMLNNRASMTADEKVEWAKRISNHSVDATTAQTIAPSVLRSVASAATNAVSSVANTRMASASGVASGDAAEKFGVWAQVIGGQATQKERGNMSGFKARTFGGVLGADTMLNEGSTFGVLVGNVNNNIKFKNSDAGNKSKANSWVFGLYGSYDIGSTDFFVQGNLTVAQTTIKSNTKQLQKSAVYEVAKAQYDVLGVGAEVMGGYKFKYDNAFVSPTVGLRYNYFGDTSYTQTGLTAGNQALKTKSANVASALAGVKIGTTLDMDGTNITPEVHTNLSYAFSAPDSKTNYAINSLKNAVDYKGTKASKFGANFGASVMAEAYGFEYGVGYDANIADKYLAHQGSLKVKVKF